MATNTFIGFESALDYWRSNRAIPGTTSRVTPRPGEKPQVDTALYSYTPGIGSIRPPFHFVVDDKAARKKTPDAVNHIWRPLGSRKSFVRIDKNLYMSTPSACFTQLASSLTFTELVVTGMELCGTYRLDGGDTRGFTTGHPALDPIDLRRYIASLESIKGAKRARHAASYVIGGSASPMETALVLLLCLPGSAGGYGLPLPQMNYRIDIPQTRGTVSRDRIFFCDLFWPEAQLDAEYDSDMFHTGREKIAEDANRRNALGSVGVKTMTITSGQIMDVVKFDHVAHTVACNLGHRLRQRGANMPEKRFQLRQMLLQQSTLMWA